MALFVLTVLGPAMTDGGPPSGNILRQVIYTGLLIGTMWMVGVFRKPSKLLVVPISILAAVAWCWISVSWSLAPAISARRVMLTTMIIWLVFLTVEECGYDRTVKALMIALFALLVLNYAAVIISPHTAIHQAAETEDVGLIGDWRGVLPQKNFTGEFCAFTILFFAFFQRRPSRKNADTPQKKWPTDRIVNYGMRAAVIAASGFFLIMSESKTSIGMAAMALAGGAIYLLLPAKTRMIVVPFAVLAATGAMLYWAGTWIEAVGPFHNPTGFTGRVQIWPHLVAYIQDHPLTGTGYGAFWNIGDESPIYAYSKNWVATVSSGHNGYLEIASQVGIPGLILTVIAAFVMPLYKLLSSTSIAPWRGALLISMIIFCAGHNMTESGLMDRDVIVWVFLLITIALIDIASGTKKPESASRSSRKRRKRALPSFD